MSNDGGNMPGNPSTVPPMRQLLALRLSRRTALKGMAAGVFGLVGCASRGGSAGSAAGASTLTFTEAGRFLDDTHHVAPGYDVSVLIRWGDPLFKDAPVFDPQRQTAAAQEQQFGSNNDFEAFMPLPQGSGAGGRGLLCVNHEYVTAGLMWPGYDAATYAKGITREQCEVEMAAHGHSIVEVMKEGGRWRYLRDSPYNRRISLRSTPIRIAGPAAGHYRLATRADVGAERIIGTLANCAGGTTPWGTVLIAEENFQYYFLGDAVGREAAAWKRYGITGHTGIQWGRYFDRFNLNREPNETNRFGWIVEIDPYDPQSVPAKRTALGRARHECATTAVSHDGRVAVYSGDDQAMEYVYKFVTSGRFDPVHRAANRDLLDSGTVFVARFEADGSLRWLPLIFGEGPLTPANGFEDAADVLIEKRRAADLLGATPMDRPEDVETNPASGRVYVVCTHNEDRTPTQINAANPRAANKYGHIIEIVPPMVDGKPDHTAAVCRWEFFLMGGDPKQPADHATYGDHGANNGEVSAAGWLATPDNLTFDPRGRIWIATDGQAGSGFADGLYAAETGGPRRGVPRNFFSCPRGAEATGPVFTPDGKTLFLSVQHPAEGSSYDRPSTRWPDFDAALPPRSAVVAITRKGGGEIGG